jgi:hypothetical protein
VPIPRSTPGSIALERLHQALRECGIHPARDQDNGQLVYLHTSTVSISVQGTHFRLERVDTDGNPTRLILLTLERVTDVVRLMLTYEESQRWKEAQQAGASRQQTIPKHQAIAHSSTHEHRGDLTSEDTGA